MRDDGDDYRRDFVYLGHQAALKDELSPLENLQARACRSTASTSSEAEPARCAARVGLQGREELAARRCRPASSRRVLLARLLLRPARLWMLDEPFNALDAPPSSCCRAGRPITGSGGMAVVTSHQASAAAGGQEIDL